MQNTGSGIPSIVRRPGAREHGISGREASRRGRWPRLLTGPVDNSHAVPGGLAMLPDMTTWNRRDDPSEHPTDSSEPPRARRQPFESLPDDWARRPMTDPDLFEGVVDLAVFETFRALGGLALLLCQGDGRLMQPLTLERINAASPPDVAEAHLSEALADLHRDGVRALVIVIARAGTATATDHDLALRQAFARACDATGMALLGVALAVPGEVSALPTPSGSEAA